MGTEYSDAIDYFVDPSRVFGNQNSRSAIVLHGTGGPETWTAQQLGDYFRTTPALTSSHFGVDRAGVICQYVRLADGAAANCCLEPGYDPFWDQFGGDNLNIHTISIEHINDVSNSLPLTDAQKEASFKLVAWLCQQYGLGVDQIKTHASIDPASRAECPGPAFPFDELKSFISNGGTMIPQGWTDDGSTLTAPNGHKVILGFRDYVLSHNWDTNNLPMEDEHGANPVEDYYDQTPNNAGSRQLFLYCELAYTAARSVYTVGIGNELLGCRMDRNDARAALATANQQITALQATIAASKDNSLAASLKTIFSECDKLRTAVGA